jgi:hypothetical protein
MATTQDLIFTVTLYKNDAKIIKFDLNYLIPHGVCGIIDRYFLPEDQNFYTSVEISHKGNVVLRKSLVNNTEWRCWR